MGILYWNSYSMLGRIDSYVFRWPFRNGKIVLRKFSYDHLYNFSNVLEGLFLRITPCGRTKLFQRGTMRYPTIFIRFYYNSEYVGLHSSTHPGTAFRTGKL